MTVLILCVSSINDSVMSYVPSCTGLKHEFKKPDSGCLKNANLFQARCRSLQLNVFILTDLEVCFNVLHLWLGLVPEESVHGHDDPGRAEPALGTVGIGKTLLNRVQLGTERQTDGRILTYISAKYCPSAQQKVCDNI